MRYCVIFRAPFAKKEGEAVAVIRFNVNDIANVEIDAMPHRIGNKHIIRVLVNGKCSSGIDLNKYNNVLKLPYPPYDGSQEIIYLNTKIITEAEFKTWEGLKVLPRIKTSLLMEDPLDKETRKWRKKFPKENNRTGNRRNFKPPVMR